MDTKNQIHKMIVEGVRLQEPLRDWSQFKADRPSSVMVLISTFDATQLDQVQMLFIKRTDGGVHGGQIAFPGGVKDPEDEEKGGSVYTAYRELTEETGIDAKLVDSVGCLPKMATRTGFIIDPHVGLLNENPAQIPLQLAESEVVRAFWVRIDHFKNKDFTSEEVFKVGGVDYRIPVYFYENEKIWGATALILKNLLDRFRKLGYY